MFILYVLHTLINIIRRTVTLTSTLDYFAGAVVFMICAGALLIVNTVK